MSKEETKTQICMYACMYVCTTASCNSGLSRDLNKYSHKKSSGF